MQEKGAKMATEEQQKQTISVTIQWDVVSLLYPKMLTLVYYWANDIQVFLCLFLMGSYRLTSNLKT